jgi:branched-chain amino acid transport system permease protein
MTMLRHLAAAIVAAGLLLLLSIRVDAFRDYQLAQVSYYAIAVAGLTVLIGLSGQVSIGHGAFMFIGAYTTALVLLHLHWALAAVLAASAVVAAVAGGIVGVAAARLRGPYLAGATLLLAVALPSITSRWQGVFGGDQGLGVTVNTPGFLGSTFPPTRWLAWLGFACALITFVLLANLRHSRIGRSWRALQDDEVAASLSGLNVARLQVLAFVVSSACAGLGGAMLALVNSSATPGTFALTLSIQLLTAAILGGLGSLAGAVWGSLVLVYLAPYITNVATSHGLSSSVGANIPIVAYGAVLIVVMLLFPSGIQGGLRRLFGPAAPAAAAPFSFFRREAPATDNQKEGTS